MATKGFLTYLQNYYDEEIIEKIQEYLPYIRNYLYLKPYALPDLDSFKVEEITLERVYFKEQKEEGQNHFILFVNTEISLEITRAGDFDYDTINRRFQVECLGLFNDGLNEFKILSVDDLNSGYSKKQKTLTTSLLPYMSRESLESRAEEFLQIYYPEALLKPTKINVNLLTNRMKIHLFQAPLKRNVFGRAFFFNSEEKIYNIDNEVELIEIPKHSILVDPEKFFIRSIGSYNNTVVHECVHLEYHSTFFEISKFNNLELKAIDSVIENIPQKYPSWYKKAYDLMEYQASYLAPRILMPAKTFLIKFKETKKIVFDSNISRLSGDVMYETIERLADFFGTSKQSVRIRLIELGVTEAAGANNYVNNKLYPNFSFRSQTISANETFTIDLRDFLRSIAMVPELSNLMISGKIVYVNGMVVINSPDYVRYDNNKNRVLTTYALNHIDECAFIFEKQGAFVESRSGYIESLNFMSRMDDPKGYVPAVYKFKSEHNLTKLEEAERIRGELDDMSEAGEIIKVLNGTTAENLDTLFRRLGFENEEGELVINQVHTHTGLDHKTIRKYLANESKIGKDKLMAICGGLKLPYQVSIHLLESEGYAISTSKNEVDRIYTLLLTQHTYSGLIKWNEVIVQSGRTDLLFTEPKHDES